jgi:CRISPR-associated exonuclease Cas4
MFCKRKLWLSLHNIDLQNLSQDVIIGKLIEENSFKRRSSKNKQILLDNIKIDYIDFKNNILYETKKSSLHINVAIMQMKYYLFLINDKRYSGVIEVPTERKKEYVT